MNDADWAELERLSGVSREETEYGFAIMELTRLRRTLLRELQATEHAARDLLRRRGETNQEWSDRHMTMSGEEKASVERIARIRFLRQDVSKTLRELRDDKEIRPSYSETQEICWAILARQEAERDRRNAQLRTMVHLRRTL